MKITRAHLLVAVVLALVVAGSIIWLINHRLAAKRADAAQRIVLVEIDDSTLQELGRWPFDRGIHANVIERLRNAAASVVIYEIMFWPAGANDERLRQVLASKGPPIIFANDNDRFQPFLFLPSVYFGHPYADPGTEEVTKIALRNGIGKWPHVVALAACITLGFDPCNPKDTTVDLYAANHPFARIQFQAISKLSESALASHLKGKIVIVGVGRAAGFSARTTEPEFTARGLAALLAEWQ